MLFTLNRQGNAVLHEDCVRMHPAFRKLKSEEINFIVLYCDYRGPFHQLPLEERLDRAKRAVWNTRDIDVSYLKDEIEEYLSIQYDRRRELIKTLQTKQELIKRQLLAEEQTSKIATYITAIESLEKHMEKLQDEVNHDEEVIIMKKGRSQSLLEILQRNKQLSKMKDSEFPAIKILFRPVETGNESTNSYS